MHTRCDSRCPRLQLAEHTVHLLDVIGKLAQKPRLCKRNRTLRIHISLHLDWVAGWAAHTVEPVQSFLPSWTPWTLRTRRPTLPRTSLGPSDSRRPHGPLNSSRAWRARRLLDECERDLQLVEPPVERCPVIQLRLACLRNLLQTHVIPCRDASRIRQYPALLHRKLLPQCLDCALEPCLERSISLRIHGVEACEPVLLLPFLLMRSNHIFFCLQSLRHRLACHTQRRVRSLDRAVAWYRPDMPFELVASLEGVLLP
mmetsp:Transcript_30836/g.77667  ORF Transcript_30836/g.77667 Transcript_30836/m.77667 type:complete len:257 (-) Transcript_30836:913-1683(-)